jgi:hypothetical protein
MLCKTTERSACCARQQNVLRAVHDSRKALHAARDNTMRDMLCKAMPKEPQSLLQTEACMLHEMAPCNNAHALHKPMQQTQQEPVQQAQEEQSSMMFTITTHAQGCYTSPVTS